MMTGLLNRRGLAERLEGEWHNYLGHEIAFVCVDLDRLKHINDTYGHAAGDFAIRLVAQGIQRSMPRDALGARIGGDEFVVFLPEAGDGGAERFVRRFERALVQLNGEEQRAFPVTASAGFAVKRLGALDTIEKCMQASDHEMYRVKVARRTARTD
jgi:diguanylate cyclase (GGDEF)-like protein